VPSQDYKLLKNLLGVREEEARPEGRGGRPYPHPPRPHQAAKVSMMKICMNVIYQLGNHRQIRKNHRKNSWQLC